MTRAFVYVVAAAGRDPDRIACAVPWEVDDDLVFFGPCKKRLRDDLRDRYFAAGEVAAPFQDDLYVVGLSPSSRQGVRTVLWVGRINRFMTFGCAYRELVGGRFERMRQALCSPLHLRPIDVDGELAGYEHVGRMHIEGDNWIDDVIRSRHSSVVKKTNCQLRLEPFVSAAVGFDRDICFVLDNILFARGSSRPGLRIDEEAAAILQEAQPDREHVGTYAVFGYRRDGSVDGRTGRYLEISGRLADDLLGWIRHHTSRGAAGPRS